MPTIRTFSDGSKLAIPDMKITRRLDAITKWVSNHNRTVAVTPSTTEHSVDVSAGTIVMNNEIKSVAAVTMCVGTAITNHFSTIWMPSTAAKTVIPTCAIVASTAALNAHFPDSSNTGVANVPDASMLLAHITRGVATLVAASEINLGVQPTLYYGTKEWRLDDGTDTSTVA